MAEHDLESVAFPTLTDQQIARLARCAGATLVCYRDGEKLFEAGDRDFKFFIVKAGSIEIVDESGDTPKTVAVHHPGQFTGDVAHLTGTPSMVTAVAGDNCEVYEISANGLGHVLNQCVELSDIILHAFIARRQMLRTPGRFTGLQVIGSRYSKDTFRVRDFLTKNRVPFTWLDLEADPQVKDLLQRFGVSEGETPVVTWGRKLLLRNPSTRELAEAIGIRRPLDHTVYDLAIVGSGPGGLAAAVYGASEGLDTVVLERSAPGGQAGTSMRIENYLGFPTGITGAELTDRAVLQASKFGARVSVPTAVRTVSFDDGYAVLQLDTDEKIVAKCVLIATGADYRRLGVEGCVQFEGTGVYYAATPNEAQLCRGSDVAIVGGGNSAGQAAVFLSQHARKVYVLIRGDDLYKSMSSYLARRIEQTENIEVLRNTEVVRMLGDSHLAAVEIVNNATGERRRIETTAVFSFIGAVPRTDWLPPDIATDAHGFVLTGAAVRGSPAFVDGREPLLLETSRRGTFAAGDVRSGSIKRVASAVGEGAMAIQFVHEHLKHM